MVRCRIARDDPPTVNRPLQDPLEARRRWHGRGVARHRYQAQPRSRRQDPARHARSRPRPPRRFTREAQLLASLNHPNIAAIYGVENRALVMELVDGQNLAGPLPDDQLEPVVEQLIDALEYAHEKGIVHRDLKPANLKLSS